MLGLLGHVLLPDVTRNRARRINTRTNPHTPDHEWNYAAKGRHGVKAAAGAHMSGREAQPVTTEPDRTARPVRRLPRREDSAHQHRSERQPTFEKREKILGARSNPYGGTAGGAHVGAVPAVASLHARGGPGHHARRAVRGSKRERPRPYDQTCALRRRRRHRTGTPTGEASSHVAFSVTLLDRWQLSRFFYSFVSFFFCYH